MKVFFNQDAIHFWNSRFNKKAIVDENCLRKFIQQYKNTSITDFVINVNFSYSVTKSNVFPDLSKKYIGNEQSWISLWNDVVNKQNIDFVSIWIDELNKSNIKPWLSFRMNDCHFEQNQFNLNGDTSVKSACIINHRERNSYFDKCLDYSNKIVRERMYNYIIEQCERYDVYGIELDFSREIYCFGYQNIEKGRAISFKFIKQIRKFLKELETKRGHQIKLSMICPSSLESAYDSGFDILKISNSKLVDVVAAAPRWASITTNIPVHIWKTMLPKKVEFGCVQQLLVSPSRTVEGVISNKEMAFGQASANYFNGADFIYLYNYFDSIEQFINKQNHASSFRNEEDIKYIIKNIGNESNFIKEKRRFPLTYDDFTSLYHIPHCDLPIEFDDSDHKWAKTVKISTGKITKDNNVYLIICTKEKLPKQGLDIFVNSKKAMLVKENKADIELLDKLNVGIPYTYKVKVSCDNDLFIEFFSSVKTTINYVEIYGE